MVLIRRFSLALLLALTSVSVTACTCNKAGTSRKAEATKPGGAIRGKASKLNRAKMQKMKGRRNGAGAPKIPVKLVLLDQAKFDAGDKDPWVTVTRQVGAKTPAKNAVWHLFKGPTEEEKAQGLVFLSSGASGFQGFSIEGDTATLQLRDGCDSGGAVTVYDHISRTLKQFPEITHVRVVGPNDGPPTVAGDYVADCLQP